MDDLDFKNRSIGLPSEIYFSKLKKNNKSEQINLLSQLLNQQSSIKK
jgi:hypothetical protein